MNKIIVTVYIEGDEKIQTRDVPGFLAKEFLFEGSNIKVSDGYHTFEKLYEHRYTIFIALCRQLVVHEGRLGRVMLSERKIPTPLTYVWRSKLHNDGSSYEGWFILGIGKEKGEQITYHIPLSKWKDTDFVNITLDKAPEFDGHTSKDVLTRLKNL